MADFHFAAAFNDDDSGQYTSGVGSLFLTRTPTTVHYSSATCGTWQWCELHLEAFGASHAALTLNGFPSDWDTAAVALTVNSGGETLIQFDAAYPTGWTKPGAGVSGGPASGWRVPLPLGESRRLQVIVTAARDASGVLLPTAALGSQTLTLSLFGSSTPTPSASTSTLGTASPSASPQPWLLHPSGVDIYGLPLALGAADPHWAYACCGDSEGYAGASSAAGWTAPVAYHSVAQDGAPILPAPSLLPSPAAGDDDYYYYTDDSLGPPPPGGGGFPPPFRRSLQKEGLAPASAARPSGRARALPVAPPPGPGGAGDDDDDDSGAAGGPPGGGGGGMPPPPPSPTPTPAPPAWHVPRLERWLGLKEALGNNYSVYRTTFPVPHLHANTSLAGSLACDTTCSVWLNGVKTRANATTPEAPTPFHITSGFVSGLNTLDVRVHNAPPAGYQNWTVSPSGMLVTWDARRSWGVGLAQPPNVFLPAGLCGGPSGVTTSPGTYLSHPGAASLPYSDNSNCPLLTFTAPAGWTVGLVVEFLDLETNYDFLHVYNGASSQSPRLAAYYRNGALVTGDSAFERLRPGDTFVSSSRKLSVAWTSDSTVVALGIRARVTHIPPPSPSPTASQTPTSSATPTGTPTFQSPSSTPSPSLSPSPSPVIRSYTTRDLLALPRDETTSAAVLTYARPFTVTTDATTPDWGEYTLLNLQAKQGCNLTATLRADTTVEERGQGGNVTYVEVVAAQTTYNLFSISLPPPDGAAPDAAPPPAPAYYSPLENICMRSIPCDPANDPTPGFEFGGDEEGGYPPGCAYSDPPTTTACRTYNFTMEAGLATLTLGYQPDYGSYALHIYGDPQACLDCDAGEHATLEGCALCPPGKWGDGTVCRACPAGTSYGGYGGVEASCGACVRSTFSPAGYPVCLDCASHANSSSFNRTRDYRLQCASCDAGSFPEINATTGAVVCQSCSPGSWMSNDTIGNKCETCSAGKYGVETGATSNATCRPCAQGAFTDQRGRGACALCAPGSFNGAVGSASCGQCPTGTFSAVPGASSVEECQPCSAGTYADFPGSAICRQCPQGAYCPPRTSNPRLCPPGSFSAASGAASAAVCTLCPAGSFAAEAGAVSCLPCDVGLGSGPGADQCASCDGTHCSPSLMGNSVAALLLAGGQGFGAANAGMVNDAKATEGYGKAARFRNPQDVDIDADGNLYVVDTGNHLVRLVRPDGRVSVLAGRVGKRGGESGFGDGVGTQAAFSSPRGLCAGGGGWVFVADTSNQRIRAIAPNGNVSTVAGGALVGRADGVGELASFNNPQGVAYDAETGSLLVADTQNSLLRRVWPLNGTVTAIIPWRLPALKFPQGLSIVRGVLLVADTGSNRVVVAGADRSSVRIINASCVLDPKSATPGARRKLSSPTDAVLDPAGVVYVADQKNHAVCGYAPSGSVFTVADGSAAAKGKELPSLPMGLAMSPSGLLVLADTGNHALRNFSSGSCGLVEPTTAERAVLWNPMEKDATLQFSQGDTVGGMAITADIDANAGRELVYLAQTDKHRIRYLQFSTAASSLTTFGLLAGSGASGFLDTVNSDILSAVPAASVSFNRPRALFMYGDSVLYLVDEGNAAIRVVYLQKRSICTCSASETSCSTSFSVSSCNTPGVCSAECSPWYQGTTAVTFKPTAISAVKTIWKDVCTREPGDRKGRCPGTGLWRARFVGLVVDGGMIYTTDANNHQVLSLYNSEFAYNTLTVLAGSATGQAGLEDSVWALTDSQDLASRALFDTPMGLALGVLTTEYGLESYLLVADAGNNRIRVVQNLAGGDFNWPQVFTLAGGGPSDTGKGGPQGGAGTGGWQDGACLGASFFSPSALHFVTAPAAMVPGTAAPGAGSVIVQEGAYLRRLQFSGLGSAAAPATCTVRTLYGAQVSDFSTTLDRAAVTLNLDAVAVSAAGTIFFSDNALVKRFGCSAGTPCPPGSFCPNRLRRLACPPRVYGSAPGLITQACTAVCPEGYFCPEGTVVPEDCKSGNACPLGSERAAPCPAGAYASGTNDNQCFACAPGTLSLAPGSAACNERCPRGTFRKDYGGKAYEDCSPCPRGSYAEVPGASYCTLCDGGYTSNASSTAQTDCTPCMEGTFARAGAGACSICPAGTYAGNTSAECVGCPQGTFSDEEGLTTADDCYPCPEGATTLSPGAVLEAQCLFLPFVCPVGFEPAVTGVLRSFRDCKNLTCAPPLAMKADKTSCIGCGPGTYGTPPNCTACSAGQLCPGLTSAPLPDTSAIFTDGGGFGLRQLAQQQAAAALGPLGGGAVGPAAQQHLQQQMQGVLQQQQQQQQQQAKSLRLLREEERAARQATPPPPQQQQQQQQQQQEAAWRRGLAGGFDLNSVLTACPMMTIDPSSPLKLGGTRWAYAPLWVNFGDYGTLFAALGFMVCLVGAVLLAITVCPCCLHAVRRCLISCDLFKGQHEFEEGEPVTKYRTSLGGLFTLLGLASLIGYGSFMIQQFFSASNVLVQGSLAPMGDDTWSGPALPWAQARVVTSPKSAPLASGLQIRLIAVGEPGLCAVPLLWYSEGMGSFGNWSWSAEASCAGPEISRHIFRCDECQLTPASSLVAMFHFSCQAYYLEAAAVPTVPQGAATKRVADPTLTKASRTARIKNITWDIHPVLSTLQDNTTFGRGRQWRGCVPLLGQSCFH